MPASKSRSIQKKKSAKDFFNAKGRKKFALFTVVVLAAIGAYLLFFAKAATNNCQPENGVQICDVDQTAASNDTVLSTNGEAESLGNQGWGTYFGTAFRAPMSAYDGAVPVTRLFNASATWHEFVTDAQKGQKEAKAGGAQNLANEGVSFFAWTDGHHPGTVPVYRMTRLGAETQAMYSTDKAWIDQQVAGPWGWKLDDTMPSIAFYAFPPGYAVAGVANPYDCSILENFTSERCKVAATNLQKNIDAGNIATTCPNTWADWNKTVNPGSLDKECQDRWNKYAQDCNNTDVFQSDRCKAQRDALAAANKQTSQSKKKATDDALKEQPASAGTGGQKGGGGGGGGGGGASGYADCYGTAFEMAASQGRRDGKKFNPDCVKAWQNRIGSSSKDGSWGPVTQAAMNAFASAHPRATLTFDGDEPTPPSSSTTEPTKYSTWTCVVNFQQNHTPPAMSSNETRKTSYKGIKLTEREAKDRCNGTFKDWKATNTLIREDTLRLRDTNCNIVLTVLPFNIECGIKRLNHYLTRTSGDKTITVKY